MALTSLLCSHSLSSGDPKNTVKSVEISIQNPIEQFIPDLSVKINLFLFYFQI